MTVKYRTNLLGKEARPKPPPVLLAPPSASPAPKTTHGKKETDYGKEMSENKSPCTNPARLTTKRPPEKGQGGKSKHMAKNA